MWMLIWVVINMLVPSSCRSTGLLCGFLKMSSVEQSGSIALNMCLSDAVDFRNVLHHKSDLPDHLRYQTFKHQSHQCFLRNTLLCVCFWYKINTKHPKTMEKRDPFWALLAHLEEKPFLGINVDACMSFIQQCLHQLLPCSLCFLSARRRASHVTINRAKDAFVSFSWFDWVVKRHPRAYITVMWYCSR